MKKVLLFSVVGGMIALASCGGGPSAEEKAAAEQAKLDSIKAAEQAKLDEMAAEAAAAEAAAYAAGQAAATATTTTTTTTKTEVVETPAKVEEKGGKLKDKVENSAGESGGKLKDRLEATPEGEKKEGGKLKDRLNK